MRNSENQPIASTEGQIPEGQEIPGLKPEASEFPPPTLMQGGREYRLLGGGIPKGERETLYHYFIPDPIEQGFSASYKVFTGDKLREIIESQKNDKHAF